MKWIHFLSSIIVLTANENFWIVPLFHSGSDIPEIGVSVAAMLNTFMLPFQRVCSDPYRHCTYTLYGASRNIDGGSGDEKGSTGNEK